METSAVIGASAILFGIAAGIGLVLGGMCVGGASRPPLWLATGHTLVTAAGLILLACGAAIVGIPPMAQLALGLLVAAAIGGTAVNLLFQRRSLLLPIPLMVGHAFVAAMGLALLLVSFYGQRYVAGLSPMVMNNN